MSPEEAFDPAEYEADRAPTMLGLALMGMVIGACWLGVGLGIGYLLWGMP